MKNKNQIHYSLSNVNLFIKNIINYWRLLSRSQPSIFTIQLSFFLTLSLFITTRSAQGADLILTPVVTNLPSNQQKIDFVIEEGFNNIVTLQFSVNWNQAAFAFQSIDLTSSDLPDINLANFGANPNNTNNGILTLSWFDQLISGVTLNNGDVLFSLIFQQISILDFQLALTDVPTTIEILDVDENVINLIFNNLVLNGETLSGHVFFDENGNCFLNSGETLLADWTIKAEGNGNTHYARTNAAGQFTILLDVGEYDLSVLSNGVNYWAPCQTTYSVTIEAGFIPPPLNVPLQAVADCPALTVDLSTAFLRRCFDNTYYVEYCNRGTALAEDATVVVTFDPFLTVQESSINWSDVTDNTYIFPIGDLNIGECGTFSILVEVSCEAILGETHCSQAVISPNDFCDPSPLWSGASIEVTGECQGNEVAFIIQNIGTENMPAPLEFIVTEDEVMGMTTPEIFQLDVLATKEVSFPANGSTWRLEAGQENFHPGRSNPIVTIEGCGTNTSGTFSLGFVTPFPQDDADFFRDIDCRENFDAFDPNDKQAIPTGFGVDHLLHANTDIEYLIRFQNTGTDTAFNIVILDTLPPEVDIATVQAGASTHSYRLDVIDSGVLRFSFTDILLPDSSTNLVGSQGFVKYRISQQPDLQDGTRIENRAAIYFDLNEPVFTNFTFHTIGMAFLELVNSSIEFFQPGVQLQVYPNPVASSSAIFEISGISIQKGQLLLFDQSGQLVHQNDFNGNRFEFQKNTLPLGLYFFQVLNENGMVSSGKLMIGE